MTQPDLDTIVALAKTAGERILEIYNDANSIDIETKADDSPLTKADLASHRCIVDALRQTYPDIPILSEESGHISDEERLSWQRYWLVDPLDGTKEFIHKNGDFTVNIALIDNHNVIMGVVHAPVFDLTYYAEKSAGAFKQSDGQAPFSIAIKPYEKDASLKVVASRRHGVSKLTDFLSRFKYFETINRGSSLKICLVAEGNADIYPRIAPTSEWDTAAAQCVLEEAGGQLFSLDDYKSLQYNTKVSLLNPFFCAVGDTAYNWSQQLGKI